MIDKVTFPAGKAKPIAPNEPVTLNRVNPEENAMTDNNTPSMDPAQRLNYTEGDSNDHGDAANKVEADRVAAEHAQFEVDQKNRAAIFERDQTARERKRLRDHEARQNE